MSYLDNINIQFFEYFINKLMIFLYDLFNHIQSYSIVLQPHKLTSHFSQMEFI